MRNDVFLSFRGVEIRKTFISHLYSSLKKKDITASEPSSFDLQAIEESEVAITVISKYYASTLDWWVDEVAKIIKCEKIATLKTVPVFFQVEPSKVLRWLGHTEKSTQLDGTQREKLEMVKKWLDAHVTNKSCFNSRDWMDDSELVDKITRFVSDILISSTSSYQSRGLTPGLDYKRDNFGFDPKPLSRIVKNELYAEISHETSGMRSVFRSLIAMLGKEKEEFGGVAAIKEAKKESFARIGSAVASLTGMRQELRALLDRECTVVGICGQEGVGKTKLARQVSEEISPQFQHNFWRTKLSFHEPSAKLKQMKQLACGSLKKSSFHGSSDDDIKEMIHRKVLLVVDDVDDIKDIKSIIKDASRLGPGSRVIVITQDRSLLTQCRVKHIYEVECPIYEEALAFFSEFAFKQRTPLPGFEALSFRAVQVSNRLPLALKMLGSFLWSKEKDEWVSTLRRLEASHNNYAAEVCRYIGADDYAPRRPMKVDQHIGVDEANRFPFYRFAV